MVLLVAECRHTREVDQDRSFPYCPRHMATGLWAGILCGLGSASSATKMITEILLWGKAETVNEVGNTKSVTPEVSDVTSCPCSSHKTTNSWERPVSEDHCLLPTVPCPHDQCGHLASAPCTPCKLHGIQTARRATDTAGQTHPH